MHLPDHSPVTEVPRVNAAEDAEVANVPAFEFLTRDRLCPGGAGVGLFVAFFDFEAPCIGSLRDWAFDGSDPARDRLHVVPLREVARLEVPFEEFRGRC